MRGKQKLTCICKNILILYKIKSPNGGFCFCDVILYVRHRGTGPYYRIPPVEKCRKYSGRKYNRRPILHGSYRQHKYLLIVQLPTCTGRLCLY